MLNQEYIDALLLRYLLGECDEGEKREVERWLAENSKSRKQFEDLQRFHTLVKRSIQERAVQSDYADFRKRLAQWQGRRRRLRILTGVAARHRIGYLSRVCFLFHRRAEQQSFRPTGSKQAFTRQSSCYPAPVGRTDSKPQYGSQAY